MLHTNGKRITKLEDEIISLLNYQVDLSENISDMGLSASEVGGKLMMERSNASRMLNKLARKGVLSKQLGRPVLFFAKEKVKERFSLEYFPSVIEDNQNVNTFMKATNDRKISAENILEIDDTLNPKMYSLLDQALNTFNYPPHGLDILIAGSEGSGKGVFIQQLFQSSISNKIFSTHSKLINIDCAEVDNEDIHSYVLNSSKNKNHRNLIVVKNIENLSEENQTKLYYLLTNKEKVFNQVVPDLFVVTTQDSSLSIYQKLRNVIPTEIIIPNFNERTIRERLLFITHFFQNEVNTLNEPVLIKYNIMNCFLMSAYPLNFLQLEKEIKHALLRSKSTSSVSPYLELNFKDLSDNLLNSMYSPEDAENEIRNLYENIGIKNVMLRPKTISPFQSALMGNHPLENKINITQENEYNLESVYFYCKEMIIDTINKQQLDGAEELADQVEFHQALQDKFPDFFLYKSEPLYNKFLLLLADLISTKDIHVKSKVNLKALLTAIDHNIIGCIEGYYNVELSMYSKIVIHYYLYIASSIINKKHVPIVIVTKNSASSTFYLNIAHSTSENTECQSYVINAQVRDQANYKNFLQLYETLNDGKGVIFLFEHDIPKDLRNILQNLSCLFIEKFTTHQLKMLISKTDNAYNFIEDIKTYISSADFLSDYSDFEHTISQLEQDILIELLTFVNPQKVSHGCQIVLSNIIKSLNIQNSERLIIQFFTHVSFMVERIRNNNILVYNNSNEYLAQNTQLVQVLEKELEVLSNMFDINIPLSEIIYIADLIKDNYPAHVDKG